MAVQLDKLSRLAGETATQQISEIVQYALSREGLNSVRVDRTMVQQNIDMLKGRQLMVQVVFNLE